MNVPSRAAVATEPLPTAHVLILDDDEAVCRMLATYLEVRGAEPWPAELRDTPGAAATTAAPAPTPDDPASLAPVRCHWMTEASELLTYLEAKLPCDAIVLDLGMPRLHGSQVLRALRQGHSSLPIIVHTGGALGHWEEEVTAACTASSEVDAPVVLVPKGPYSAGEVHRQVGLALAWAAGRR